MSDKDELERQRFVDIVTWCERQSFEEWAEGEGWKVERYREGYNNITLNDLWRGWLARSKQEQSNGETDLPAS